MKGLDRSTGHARGLEREKRVLNGCPGSRHEEDGQAVNINPWFAMMEILPSHNHMRRAVACAAAVSVKVRAADASDRGAQSASAVHRSRQSSYPKRLSGAAGKVKSSNHSCNPDGVDDLTSRPNPEHPSPSSPPVPGHGSPSHEALDFARALRLAHPSSISTYPGSLPVRYSWTRTPPPTLFFSFPFRGFARPFEVETEHCPRLFLQ